MTQLPRQDQGSPPPPGDADGDAGGAQAPGRWVGLVEGTYGALMMASLCGGLLILALSVFGLLAGGPVGQACLFANATVVKRLAIASAAAAVAAGLIATYARGNHSLSLQKGGSPRGESDAAEDRPR